MSSIDRKEEILIPEMEMKQEWDANLLIAWEVYKDKQPWNWCDLFCVLENRRLGGTRDLPPLNPGPGSSYAHVAGNCAAVVVHVMGAQAAFVPDDVRDRVGSGVSPVTCRVRRRI